VYCYAFLHVLKRDTSIRHEERKKERKKKKERKRKKEEHFFFSLRRAGPTRKMPWLEP
jgi:hypothetical protein